MKSSVGSVLKLHVVAAIVAMAAVAHADVLYTQAPDYVTSIASATNYFGLSVAAFDDFKLASGSVIDSVSWIGFDIATFPNDPTPGQFTVGFYSDASGSPGSLLQTTTVTAGPGSEVDGSYSSSYSAAVDPFSASAGVTYWLSIVYTNGSIDGASFYGWGSSPTGYGNAYFYDPGEGGFVSRAGVVPNLAFSLDGGPDVPSSSTTPEPSSLLLLGTGLTGMFAVARRRRMNAQSHSKDWGTALACL